MSVRKVLSRARRLVKSGWIQGRSYDTVDGKLCYCITGAIKHATIKIAPPEERSSVFVEALNQFSLLNGLSSNIPAWNDSPERTQQEVIEAFDKAIEGETL